MSNLSTFTGSANPIGSQQLMAQRAPLITLGTQEWLRSGFLASAASYPAVAAIDHLRAHNLTETTSAAPGGTASSIATNGTSTFVIGYGSTAQVYTSTDSGVTWAQQNHNGTQALRKVIWNGTRFIGVTNDATTLRAVTSTDGITWTANTIAAPGGMTVNTATVAWNGTVVIVAVQGVSNAYTSTSGTGSWTPQALGSTVDSAPQIDATSFQSVILDASGTSHYKSANGTSWSALTTPVNIQSNSKPIVFSDKVVISISNSQIIYSSDMTNWTTVTTGFTLTGSATRDYWKSGTRYCFAEASGRIPYTINGIDWFCHSTSDTAGNFIGAQGSTNMVFANAGADGKPRYAVNSSMTSANSVGFSTLITGDAGNTAYGVCIYTRIK